MKKVMMLATVLSITLGLFAQTGKDNKQQKMKHKVHMKHQKKAKMVHQFKLSDEQKQQAKIIQQEFSTKVKTLKKNDAITMGEFKKQMAALQADRKTKMTALLTAEQKATIANRKKRMQEEAQVQAAARLERMKIKLELSEEQVAKIKSNQQVSREKAKAIRENSQLSKMEQQEQLKDLKLKQKEMLLSVLTKEQKSKLEEHRKEKMHSKK